MFTGRLWKPGFHGAGRSNTGRAILGGVIERGLVRRNGFRQHIDVCAQVDRGTGLVQQLDLNIFRESGTGLVLQVAGRGDVRMGRVEFRLDGLAVRAGIARKHDRELSCPGNFVLGFQLRDVRRRQVHGEIIDGSIRASTTSHRACGGIDTALEGNGRVSRERRAGYADKQSADH